MPPESDIEIVERGLAAWNEATSALLELLHDDVEWVPLQDLPDLAARCAGARR